MKLIEINHWLTLIANVAVLIGILVVAIELNQTQTAMLGEASTMRAQMAMDISKIQIEYRVFELREKLAANEEFTSEERARGQAYYTTVIRNFENLHYQNQIGILDDEIWQANLGGLGNICNNPLFQYLFPNFGNGFRESFVDLFRSPCR